MCYQIDVVYKMITSIEFWVGFIIRLIIIESIKLRPMNNIKIIIAGVGAMMWGPKAFVTCEVSIMNSI